MRWSQAFLSQARSDFDVHRLLSKRPDLPRCHSLHYLQMAAEKLAKSFLCHDSKRPPPESHAVISRFIRSCNSNRPLRDRFQMEHQAFSSMLRKHVRVAEYVESLAPALSYNVNAEYPWLDAVGEVIAPCDHSFGEVAVTEMAQFISFLEQLLRIQSEL